MSDLESLRQIYEEYAEHDDTKASNTDMALRDALAVIEAQEKEIARLKEGFHSGEQVLEHYVPGYVQKCESCGGPTKLPEFEALP